MSTLAKFTSTGPEYHDILESIYDGYYEVDERANLVLLNSSLCEILMLPEEELTGDRYMRHVRFSTAKSLLRLFQFVQATGQPQRTYEFEFETWDGGVLMLEASATLIVDEFDLPKGMRGIIRNVSNRKKAERANREREQRYRSLFEQNTDAVVQFDLNAIIVDANPVASTFVGYSSDELKGLSLDAFLSAKDAETFRRAFAFARTGLSGEYEVRVRHRSGKAFRTHVRTIPTVIDGEVIGIYAICRDVTEQYAAAKALQRLNMFNKSILQSAAEGICGVDTKGHTVFFNAAAEAMTGYSADDMIGRNLHEMLHRSCSNGIHHKYKDCATYEAIHSGKIREQRDEVFWRKDGTSFVVDYVVSPIKVGGRSTGAVIIFRDVTQQRQAEDLLLKSEKLSVVGQLAAGIAHEIRNPLTALKGFLQLAGSQPDSTLKYAHIMYAELERIESITNELLAFARPQATQFRSVELTSLVESVQALLSSQALMQGVSFTLSFRHGDARIYCEPNRIRQVLVNLLKNAIDALSGGGRVSILTWQMQEYVFIAVQDTGTGMDMHTLKRVGEPFYTTKVNGTGLGTMVCQRIVESHRGFIEWQSELGRGTTVTIQLPLEQSYHKS